MKNVLFGKLLAKATPVALGALGAYLAMTAPVHYAALCSGSGLVL